MASAQWGLEDGAVSFYGAAEGVTDEGWRFHSQSNLARLYADAGWRFRAAPMAMAWPARNGAWRTEPSASMAQPRASLMRAGASTPNPIWRAFMPMRAGASGRLLWPWHGQRAMGLGGRSRQLLWRSRGRH